MAGATRVRRPSWSAAQGSKSGWATPRPPWPTTTMHWACMRGPRGLAMRQRPGSAACSPPPGPGPEPAAASRRRWRPLTTRLPPLLVNPLGAWSNGSGQTCGVYVLKLAWPLQKRLGPMGVVKLAWPLQKLGVVKLAWLKRRGRRIVPSWTGAWSNPRGLDPLKPVGPPGGQPLARGGQPLTLWSTPHSVVNPSLCGQPLARPRSVAHFGGHGLASPFPHERLQAAISAAAAA